MHFMKEYFNSFDDIQFFSYIFINISRYEDSNAKRNTPLYQNFMLYKMIYFSSHKFAFSNLRFSPFYENFRQLREKYAFKLKIKYIMLISSLRWIWWCPYIWLFLKETTPLHTLHWTIQNILFAANPFHCFFAKSKWAGKKLVYWYNWYINTLTCVIGESQRIQQKVETKIFYDGALQRNNFSYYLHLNRIFSRPTSFLQKSSGKG